MRAYVRVDPMLPEHKADAQQGADYPDGAGFTFVLTLCWASRQAPPGFFRNRGVLAALLGRRARWVQFLVDHHDLVEFPDGRLYVEGWNEWQEGQYPSVAARAEAITGRSRPLTDAERQRAYRERKRREREAGAVTTNVTPSRDASRSDDQRHVTARHERHVTALQRLIEPSVGVSHSVGAGRDVTPSRPNGRSRPKDDEELRVEAIARARAKLADPAASDDLKAAARFSLHQLGADRDEPEFGSEPVADGPLEASP